MEYAEPVYRAILLCIVLGDLDLLVLLHPCLSPKIQLKLLLAANQQILYHGKAILAEKESIHVLF